MTLMMRKIALTSVFTIMAPGSSASTADLTGKHPNDTGIQ